MMLVFGAMGVKFIICIGALVGYLLIIKPESKLFIVPFFILYASYTVLETIYLSKHLRNQDQN